MSLRFLPVAALAIVAACTPAANPVTTSPIVGVLEERAGATTDEAPRHVVRALFHKGATGWESYDPNCSDEACLTTSTARFPAETAWTISNQGQSLGEVTAATPSAWALYADAGQQELAADAHPPTLGERSNDFAPDAGVPLHRPLVATSPGAFADPQAWASAPATAEAQLALRQGFVAQFTGVTNCADATTPPQPRSYTEADIEISRTFASSTGWRIATARLLGYACDGPLEGAYAEQTFAISPANDVRLLGEGYRFLDAGDFDNDGQAEVIFVINQYNTGGYALFANDFGQNAVFDFNYH